METKYVRVPFSQDELDNEVWRSINGYPNYQVSNLGRIKSLNYLHTKKEREIKPFLNKGGYLYIVLCNNGIKRKFRIHRLVALSFIPNPSNKTEINHINECKTDNRVSNLEWVTPKENANYGMRNENISKSKNKHLLQFSKNGELIKRWESPIQVEDELGYKRSNIASCCRGVYKTAYGYKWEYEQTAHLLGTAENYE